MVKNIYFLKKKFAVLAIEYFFGGHSLIHRSIRMILYREPFPIIAVKLS